MHVSQYFSDILSLRELYMDLQYWKIYVILNTKEKEKGRTMNM